ncbi:cytochrome d ubiquinol oxidase subunit II [Zhouia sp. PK063]|uniref:cytochrome d ubiquinol oxidase subunit II n=1 Tax=Zhouia sp. PK063 TaxID=3373602 RepID=UPI0037A63F96
METFLGIDYPTWWFLVVGGLFSGYAILDGFDFGAGAWHLFFRKEESRRIALNAVGPVWDGNEVWLVIGGGALFAGFPVMYASMFSAMYIPFMLFLLFIIFRAISIEFRSKEQMLWWRKMWDISYSVSSIMLAFLLGVVVGNILQGIALDANYEYTGSWLDFLNPYALMTGVLTLSIFMMHGAIYLLMKTEGKLYDKLTRLLKKGMIFFMVTFGLVTLYTLLYIPHLSDDLKDSTTLFIVPVLVFLSIANVPRLASKHKFRPAFFFSSLTLALLMVIVAIELYPVLLISTTNMSQNSITIYNAAASSKSLGIMLIFVAVGGPLVLSYTAFVYKTFKGKVKIDEHSY